MADWLFKEIPVYKVYLGFCGLLLFLCLIASFFEPHFGKKQARGLATRSEIRMMDLFLTEYVKANGRLPFGDNVAIVAALSAMITNEPVLFTPWETNGKGEAVDYWKMPFQIQFAGATNFIIRSAGKDKIFGDADDIVFNSVSNDFVRP